MKANGFTLPELLIALTIVALILAGLGSTLHAVFTSERVIKETAARDRLAGVMLERLSRELASVLEDAPDPPLLGADADRTDTLSIWTGAYGAPRRVHYLWNAGRLERIEENPLSRESPRRIAIPDVTAFNLRYHDSDTWRESWDSATLPQGAALAIVIHEREDGTIVTIRP